MTALHLIVWVFSVGLMALSLGTASGQSYPNKPVRIVTTGVGGGNDFVARVIAQELAAPLTQPVIVDNRVSGPITGEIVSKALPDGYTLLVSGAPLWIGSLLQKMPYDPIKDFSPVTVVDRSPNVLIVHPGLPAKSVKELIALAKSKPGGLNYSSGSTGGSNHLSGELFKAMAGVDIVRVVYKSSGAALVDLLGGQVQMTFDSNPALMSNIKAGKLRALAVTSAEQSTLFPELPTIAASGLPGYDSVSIHGVFTPANTPASIINRLNHEIVRILKQTDVRQKFLSIGAETVGSSPEQFAVTIKSDMARMGKIIKDAGIRAD